MSLLFSSSSTAADVGENKGKGEKKGDVSSSTARRRSSTVLYHPHRGEEEQSTGTPYQSLGDREESSKEKEEREEEEGGLEPSGEGVVLFDRRSIRAKSSSPSSSLSFTGANLSSPAGSQATVNTAASPAGVRLWLPTISSLARPGSQQQEGKTEREEKGKGKLVEERLPLSFSSAPSPPLILSSTSERMSVGHGGGGGGWPERVSLTVCSSPRPSTHLFGPGLIDFSSPSSSSSSFPGFSPMFNGEGWREEEGAFSSFSSYLGRRKGGEKARRGEDKRERKEEEADRSLSGLFLPSIGSWRERVSVFLLFFLGGIVLVKALTNPFLGWLDGEKAFVVENAKEKGRIWFSLLILHILSSSVMLLCISVLVVPYFYCYRRSFFDLCFRINLIASLPSILSSFLLLIIMRERDLATLSAFFFGSFLWSLSVLFSLFHGWFSPNIREAYLWHLRQFALSWSFPVLKTVITHGILFRFTDEGVKPKDYYGGTLWMALGLSIAIGEWLAIPCLLQKYGAKLEAADERRRKRDSSLGEEKEVEEERDGMDSYEEGEKDGEERRPSLTSVVQPLGTSSVLLYRSTSPTAIGKRLSTSAVS